MALISFNDEFLYFVVKPPLITQESSAVNNPDSPQTPIYQ